MISDLLSTGWLEATIILLMFLGTMLGLSLALWAIIMMARALIATVEERFFGVRRKGPNRRIPLYSVSDKTGEINVRHPLAKTRLVGKGGK
jgi:hypothetical protein